MATPTLTMGHETEEEKENERHSMTVAEVAGSEADERDRSLGRNVRTEPKAGGRHTMHSEGSLKEN